MADADAALAAVTAAYGWQPAELSPLPGGLINVTYQVRRSGEPRAVLQQLHPVFGPAVNDDIDAVTTHLARHGMITPRLIRTLDGRSSITVGGHTFRAMTWIDGVTVHAVPGLEWAEAGGELVGRFHRAVSDLEHRYSFARPGVHDTAAHFARLAASIAQATGERAIPAQLALGREILAVGADLPPLGDLPRRHCHGDLKISNLLFARDAVRGVALVDLDTVGLGTLAFELGDAMRSWCNPRGEDAAGVVFDQAIFGAAMTGFCRAARDVVTAAEVMSVVTGLETVCIELAARFAVDMFRDEYFGWDATRFRSRVEHNEVRARGQLRLGLAVRGVRAEVREALAACLA